MDFVLIFCELDEILISETLGRAQKSAESGQPKDDNILINRPTDVSGNSNDKEIESINVASYEDIQGKYSSKANFSHFQIN